MHLWGYAAREVKLTDDRPCIVGYFRSLEKIDRMRGMREMRECVACVGAGSVFSSMLSSLLASRVFCSVPAHATESPLYLCTFPVLVLLFLLSR